MPEGIPPSPAGGGAVRYIQRMALEAWNFLYGGTVGVGNPPGINHNKLSFKAGFAYGSYEMYQQYNHTGGIPQTVAAVHELMHKEYMHLFSGLHTEEKDLTSLADLARLYNAIMPIQDLEVDVPGAQPNPGYGYPGLVGQETLFPRNGALDFSRNLVDANFYLWAYDQFPGLAEALVPISREEAERRYIDYMNRNYPLDPAVTSANERRFNRYVQAGTYPELTVERSYSTFCGWSGDNP